MPLLSPIDRRIARIAIPAVGALAIDPLYELSDTAILGHLGRDQLAGAAAASSILLTASAVFIFVSFTTTAAIARLRGSGDERAAAGYAVQVTWLALAIGLAVPCVLVWFTTPLLELFGATGGMLHQGEVYLRISLLGVPAVLVGFAGAGVHRGRHDTVRILRVSGAGVALNLVLEVVMIYGLGMGVAASALTTVIARWLVALVYVGDVGAIARRHRIGIAPDPAEIRRIGVTGGPLLVRTLALRAALSGGVAAAGRVGTIELAAFTIGFQIWSFLAYLADGLETAGQAILGEELGRDDMETAHSVGRRLLWWAGWIGLLATGLVLAARPALTVLFTSDPAVRDGVGFSLLFVAAAQILNTVAFTLDGILVGLHDQRFLAIAMVACAVAYLTGLAVLRAFDGGLAALWMAQIGFMASRVATLGSRFIGRRLTRLRSSSTSSR